MTIVTLLTDFGLQDAYVGVMKGVIWGIAPDVQIADLTHDIPPQDVLQGALALARAVPYFPAGTIHVAVVDPGVGTSRRPLAARLGDHFFVSPDNGLCSLVLTEVEAHGEPVHFIHLNQPQYWLPQVSSSFHARDIFAPVAAHLANGVPLEALGSFIDDPVRLELPQPMRMESGWHAQVIHIDRFGNLATNLRREHLPARVVPVIRLKGREIRGLVEAYGARPPGELVGMFDSSGFLAVAVVNGDAARLLRVQVGDAVEVLLYPAAG